jgi:choline kinase
MHNKNPVSVVILSTLPDSGIKSLGSKSLLSFKNQYLIEYQINTIRSALKNIDHEIIIMCGFDGNRVYKTLSPLTKKLNIKLIKENYDPNLNFGGSFLRSLEHIRYDQVLSINYGNLFKKNVIQSLINNKITTIGITKNHPFNDNIKLGCHIQDNNVINIFYNLGNNKYLDINFWSNDIIAYIKKYISFEDHKNKFIFEIINLLNSCNHKLIFSDINTKDCIFIDSLNTLTKSKRIFTDVNITNKKTKY